jgi:MFS family permease
MVWSLVTWLTGRCQTVEQLLAARAVMGISEACYIPAALALIADYHPATTRSRATGIHMSGIYAGAALGGVGGYIAEHFGWRTGFTLFGLVGIGYAVVLALVLRDAPRMEGRQSPSAETPDRLRPYEAFKALFMQPSYYVLLLHVSLLALAFWGINGWLPTYLKEHFHLGQGEAGLSATGYIQAASFLGILIGGYWADKWIRSNVRGRILVPTLGFAFAAPALYMAASTGTMPVAIAGLAVFGLARGFSDANMMPILCQVVDSRCRATGYGIMNFFSCLVGGAMVYVGGALKDRQVDLGTIFQYAALGLFFAAAVLLLIRPRRSETLTPKPKEL